MNHIPDQLLQHPALWRARDTGRARRVVPSGWPELDQSLADGGWPQGALSELLSPSTGLGEVRLALPAIRQALAERPGYLVLVSPPWIPHAPAWQAAGISGDRLLILYPRSLADWRFATEQACRAGMPWVQSWSPSQALADRDLRRLQLAAQEGGGQLLLVRPSRQAQQPSPAALRLQLEAHPGGKTRITLLKQRGGFGGHSVVLDMGPSCYPPRKEWHHTSGISLSAKPEASSRQPTLTLLEANQPVLPHQTTQAHCPNPAG